jgi:hypothetical protein
MPLPNPPPVTSRKRKRRSRRLGSPSEGSIIVAKTEPLVRREPDQAVAARRLPLLPLLRAVVSFHAGDTVPRFYTDASTSARGHQGEDPLPPLVCGYPGRRAEGETRCVRRRAAAV